MFSITDYQITNKQKTTYLELYPLSCKVLSNVTVGCCRQDDRARLLAQLNHKPATHGASITATNVTTTSGTAPLLLPNIGGRGGGCGGGGGRRGGGGAVEGASVSGGGEEGVVTGVPAPVEGGEVVEGASQRVQYHNSQL